MVLSQFTYWSPTHGAEVTRLSTTDAEGSEFFAFLPSAEGKRARVLREKAAGALRDAVDLGLTPGEVRWK